MSKRIKRVVSAILVLAMAASLCACGNSSTSSASSTAEKTESTAESKTEESSKAETATTGGDESKEIIFWNIGTEEPDKSIYEYAIDKFNKTTKSGYTVKSVTTQNDSYKEKIIVAMSSGECPDMYTSWSGGPMNEYINSGFAQPIDEYMDSTLAKDKVMPAALEQGKYNGKQYGMPILTVSISGVFYNTEMFEKYGLKEPKTLAELDNCCKVLKENGITPFALANSSKWTGSMYFMNLAARKGGLEPFQSAVAGTGSFEDESFEFAGNKIQEWVNNGYFPEGVNSLSEDDGQARQLMYQEKAGMLLCGSWYAGTFANDSKEFYEKIKWFSFPEIEGSKADPSIQIGTIGDQFISFNCTGDKLKAAVEFSDIFHQEDVVSFMVEKGKIPPMVGIENQIEDPVLKLISTAASTASSVQLWYDQYLPPAVAQTHLDTCQEIFGLTMTPKDADKQLQDSMKKYLDEK